LARNFGQRLERAFRDKGQLCVGIDPHASLLESWGLQQSVSGLRAFSLRVVDAAHSRVGIIKPQVSFFERFGSKGFAVLEEVTQYAAQADLIVIADAKRGDIGTTMDAYFEAWFGDDSALFADALTVSPYLGLGAVTNGFARFEEQGKGLFSLVATSNPEGHSVQLAKIGSDSLAVDQLRQLGTLNADSSTLGNFGAVLGATLNFDDFGINLNASTTPVLAPGFGAQGAQLSDARRIFGDRADQVCYSVSRSVLSAGPSGVDQLVDSAAKELAIALEK